MDESYNRSEKSSYKAVYIVRPYSVKHGIFTCTCLYCVCAHAYTENVYNFTKDGEIIDDLSLTLLNFMQFCYKFVLLVI